MAFNGEIYEIFSWLPPKLLYKLSSKSKPCSEFLSESRFVEKQCRNSEIKPVEYILTQDDSNPHSKAQYLRVCTLGDPDHDQASRDRISSMIPSKEFNDLKDNSRVIASSNGILLCQTYNFQKPMKFFLCNPATRSIAYIQPPSKDIMVEDTEVGIDASIACMVFICGKNYSEKPSKFPMDYTLLLFYHTPTWSNYRNVYVLKHGNWELKRENLFIGPGNVDFQNPVHCTDGLYLLSDASYLLHYDIQHGTSRILPLPNEAQDDDIIHTSIGIFGWEKSDMDHSCFRSICLVKIKYSEIISIWTLDIGHMDRDKLIWRETSIMNKSRVDDLGIEGFVSWRPSFAIIEKKLIMAAGRHVYSYCLEDMNMLRKAKRVSKINGDPSGPFRFYSYSSTLRPCNKDIITGLMSS
ncbi:uncharacterized protein LOC141621004 [Silene latifolia]|uniref:uncharacterized protein LOC141621004 n=1 Tax=Silene latifolia TaxID=37657 RepID=UPI003D77FEDB